jgi:uncharacterized membrane protein YbhN (UPF0104 family)
MNNQTETTIALHPLNMSLDPAEEALSHLSHLSKERRKKAALQLLNQLHLADRTEIAQEAGVFSVNQQTRDLITRVIVSTFVFIMAGAFLALVLFDWLGAKANTDLLFTLITTTGGFLAGLLVPSPSSSNDSLPNTDDGI